MTLAPEDTAGGHPPSPRPPLIRVLPIGAVDPTVLAAIQRGLESRFEAPVRIDQGIPLRGEWFDDAREQYHAEPILDTLILRYGREGWSLGVVDADLFLPGLDFIFGEATVAGCCAVIGLARLDPRFHGQNPDPERFRRRALTEAVHELGHVAGLDHCPDPRCVMSFSRNVDDVDRKSADFCPRCGGGRRGV